MQAKFLLCGFTENPTTPQLSEILALIEDLGLVPRNAHARDFYGIVELIELERATYQRDLQLLSKRNHSRSNVHPSDCGNLFPEDE